MSISPEELRRWARLLPTAALAIASVVLLLVLGDRGRTAVRTAPAAESVTTPATAASYASPLGLRVTSKPQQLQVYWNRDAAAIHDASKGVMKVSDGEVSEVIPFDVRQLQDGYLVYRPQTNDVSVRLEVDQRNGQPVSESVRVVAMP
ncbi:MAG: hypothetical protein LAP38_12365 [Acidobacteriia bacterium]|nr:hypothetical protein [Terriglobia bacterium]